jgi:hypothetical protein
MIGIIHSPTKPMLDAIILDHLDRDYFGKVRLFGILGSGLGSYLGGRLLIYTKQNSQHFDSFTSDDDVASLWNKWCFRNGNEFNLLFLAHVLLTVPTFLAIQQLQNTDNKQKCLASSKREKDHGVNQKNTSNSNGSNNYQQSASSQEGSSSSSSSSESSSAVSVVCQELDHILFFVIVYLMGSSGGVSDTFTYVRFHEVGCNTNHMGISRMISSVAGAIMFWYSAQVSEFLGTENVLVLSLICVGFRFSLLETMDGPIYGYIAEGIRGSIFGAFWSAATVYASSMGGARATMLLLLNGIYNGIGRSTGSYVGGKIQESVGSDGLFRCMCVITLCFAAFMFCYYNLTKQRRKVKTMQKDVDKETKKKL